jgi:SpoVK/Ycf46/Vps4 family AAA+-type ATPase
MLNAREPKIFDKYVTVSEANIEGFFAEAKEEEKRVCLTILSIKNLLNSFFSWDPTVVYM